MAPLYTTFVDTIELKGLACSTTAIVAHRLASSSLPQLRRALDTFVIDDAVAPTDRR